MKLRILIATMVFAVLSLFTGILYAANGDIIVNGNLGVGTTTPAAKAEVNGNMQVDGNMTVQGNLITNGTTTLNGNTVVNGSATVNGQLSVGAGGVKFADGSAQTTAKTLVWDYTVTGTPVTSVTSTTLDGNAHGGYWFEVDYVYATTSALNLDLYINNDITNTNYICNYVLNNSSNAVTEPRLFSINNTSAYGASVHGIISIRPDGYQQADFTGYDWAAGAFYRLSGSFIRKISDANITRIDIVSSVPNGIGVNSRFRLWKRIQ